MAMTQEHKDALAQGRREARAIKHYLDALASRSAGRRVTNESLRKRLVSLNEKIAIEEDPLRQVELVQARLDVEKLISTSNETTDIDALQAAFVKAVTSYSERKNISYTAWRKVGVPASILKRSGIKEARRR